MHNFLQELMNSEPNTSDVASKNMLNLYYNASTVKLCLSQRGPAWGNNSSNMFFNDVKRTMNNHYLYYFGTIILAKTNNKNSYEIIDGQQRITAGMIFITAIRDAVITMNSNHTNFVNFINSCNKLLFKSNTYNANKSQIFLKIRNIRNTPSKIYTKNYQGYFNSLLIGNKTNIDRYDDGQYKPIKLLKNEYNTFQEDISNLLKDKSTDNAKFNILKKLLKSFLQKFYVAIVYLSPKSTNINITFTTTNDRGVNLTVADKTKNRLITVMDKYNYNSTQMRREWRELSNELHGNSKTISKFISTYWDAKYRHYTAKELAQEINNTIRNVEDVNTLMSDLLHLVPMYMTLSNKISYSIFKTNTNKATNFKINRIIQELNCMKFVQYYPVILAMYKYRHKYTHQDYYEVMNKIKKIEMRRQILHANHTKYVNEAHHIWDDHLPINDILNKLDKHVSNDHKTELGCQIYGQRFTHTGQHALALIYILAKIYKIKNKDFNDNNILLYKEIFKDHKFRAIHIYPDTIKGQANDLINNLGNWTIIEDNLYNQNKHKVDFKNPNTQSLKKILSKSNLRSNHKILKSISNTKYPKNFIEHHQKRLALYFVKAW